MARSRFNGGTPWRLFVSAMFLLAFCGAAAAQYTDRQAIDDLGGPQRTDEISAVASTSN